MEPTRPTTPFALVFTDVVGSSAAKRAAGLGADANARDRAYLQSVQTRYLHLVRDTIATHGGKEIMTIGDAFFLTFEDAGTALLCASEIQIRLRSQAIMTSTGQLKLRIGIHVGTPEFFENSWHGTDVDTAARAESAGSPDQIILTDAAREHLGDFPGIHLTPLGTFALKGVGDVKLWDADYDEHGPRKPQFASIESVRRQHRIKLAWRAGYALLAILILLGGFYGYRQHQTNKFTERDKVILADFDNKTGDPVFDATLKEALSIQLEQSPYLQLVGDQELHADLRYLNQPTEQRITPALARELGQREGIKAYITASVANIGTSYIVSVDAVNTATGDPIARAQAESSDKNHVLTAVATAATSLRAKLGESLASVQKLTTPFMDVTTSSLEAFHAFSLGESAHEKSEDPEALTYYQQAVDLDPNFAMAWARIGVVYNNRGQKTKSLEAMTKAYDLRQHATERERLYITAQLGNEKGDIPGAIAAFQALLTAYPDDPAGLNNLAIMYVVSGDEHKAAGYFKQVADAEHWDVAADDNLAAAYLSLDDTSDANRYIDFSAAVSRGTDTPLIANQLVYAVETGGSWKAYIDAADSRPDGFLVYQSLSDIEYMQGAITDARAAAQQAATMAMAAKAPDAAGNLLSTAALMEAEYGECTSVPSLTKEALSHDSSAQTLPGAAAALALCGQGSTELASLRKLAAAAPDDTVLNAIDLPQAEAAAVLAQHRPQDVFTLLKPTHPYILASIAPIIEAEAQLQLHRPADAIASLQPVLQYRYSETQMGGNGIMPSYTMATLLTARAYTMLGDKPKAIAAYQRALDLWKNADPTFKPLAEAKKELAALQ
jgi:class 3 adenylate cyclase/tetratricopeptide (TPR) repeat protein